jgi:hypothetical protein
MVEGGGARLLPPPIPQPMGFTGENAAIQQRLAACHEMGVRRYAVLQELAPRRGERVIEVGGGAGGP